MLIDLFIEAGWYTVPMKGALKRLESGKKTLPNLEQNWRKKYTSHFNKKPTRLAGAITGNKSGIIAIDCDNQLTYDMFLAMDVGYMFHFISKGKPSGGGTIIYKYTDKVSNFKVKDKNTKIELDFFADDGFIYLPTEDNYTKMSWQGVKELPKLKECPPTVLAMLKTFKSQTISSKVLKLNENSHAISNRLAPMMDMFIKNKVYDPVLFKIITPRTFRNLPSYVKMGHLKPSEVPKGRGSEYLSKVSAILGSDISISMEIYTKAMMLINSLKETPKEQNELMSTIINPMLEERASIDGKVIWQYDPHWMKMGFMATALNGDYLESFYDDVKGLYYLINYTVPYLRTYGEKRSIINTFKALIGRPLTENGYDSTKQLIRTSLNPAVEFGHIEGTDKFNLFRQTQALSIVNNPSLYKDQYSRPTHIINYFESLIPDDYMRSYVLSFIKTKLMTFKYSPVILYFIGIPGSGKDTLVNLLRHIIGQEYVSKPDTKVFLEQYNGWMVDKYLIQLDEYGNKLTRPSDKQEVLGKLKAYTGSAEFQVRAMRQDGFNYKHSTTFIMTANSNPLPIETGDRRVAFIKTPNVLKDQEWVTKAGGVARVVEELIPSEILDFCYYLGTEIKQLNSEEYVTPPETADKERLILDNLPAVEQLAYYMHNSKYEELSTLADEYGVLDFEDSWEDCRLKYEKIAELYDIMTEGAGTSRALINKLRDVGIVRKHTTKGGKNDFYYFINGLHRFKTNNDHGFESHDKPLAIKGLE